MWNKLSFNNYWINCYLFREHGSHVLCNKKTKNISFTRVLIPSYIHRSSISVKHNSSLYRGTLLVSVIKVNTMIGVVISDKLIVRPQSSFVQLAFSPWNSFITINPLSNYVYISYIFVHMIEIIAQKWWIYIILFNAYIKVQCLEYLNINNINNNINIHLSMNNENKI